jgi:glycosyltransferase involved in cell wall biosynthesis
MRSPLVSIIMPAYNCEHYIGQAITSILNQSYSNVELLVCDDGSTDKTLEVIKSFDDSRIKIFINEANIGNLKTRNRLFELAKGEFIAVQDADDWSSEDRIELQVKSFYQDECLGACVTSFYRVDINGKVSLPNVTLSKSIEVGADFEGDLPFHMPTIMIRRNVFKEIGGLNPFFDRLFAEDHYWVYLIRERFKTICLHNPLYYYRFNPDSLTNNINNIRKLSITDVVHFLIRQRRERGTDWLEEGKYDDLMKLESSFLSSKMWLAEKYRVYSAVKIDANKFEEAKGLLWASLKLQPFSIRSLRTFFYYFRKRYLAMFK